MISQEKVMLYVERAEDGKIIALRNTPTKAAQEQKSLMDEEVLAFMDSSDSWKQIMAFSDLATIRIVEDLIDILVRKNVIQFTELPEHAQKRIMERKRIREKFASQDLLVDDIL